jgi:hypothetical protein
VNPSPIAFMSYARDDDEHDLGRLSNLRIRLSGELGAQSGETFPIFQDREDIAWGQQWRKRIDESLDGVTFLIPILTPRFFRSAACRDELKRFLKREEELRRGDLILPIYYLDSSTLNDPAKRSNDDLAEIIHSRQYWDWRQLRFEPLDSKKFGETIAKMAKQLITALERPALADPARTLSGLGVQTGGTAEPFKEAAASHSPAFFFPRGATIASFGYPNEQEYSFDGDKVIYLRLLPKSSKDQPKVGRSILKKLFYNNRSLIPMSPTIGGLVSSNDYGWVVIDPTTDNTTKGITQGFSTGELWGINSQVFVPADFQQFARRATASQTALPILNTERLYTRTLENYVSTAASEFKLQLPFVVEVGALGLKGVLMGAPHPEAPGGHYYGPFREDSLIQRYELDSATLGSLHDVLRQFLDELYDLAECVRSSILTEEHVTRSKIPPLA